MTEPSNEADYEQRLDVSGSGRQVLHLVMQKALRGMSKVLGREQ